MIKNLFRRLLGKPYVYSEAKGQNNQTFFIKHEGVDYTLSITHDEGTTYCILNERYIKEGGRYYNLSGQVGTITHGGVEELIEPDEERVNHAKFEFLHEKLKEFKQLVK